jgi:hypothetical protein
MIYNLRRKFILVSAFSVSLVFVLIFGIIYIISTSQLNATMDILTDVISKNGGVFPDFDKLERPSAPVGFHNETFLSPDTPFSTRFFTVWLDKDNQVLRENTEQTSIDSKEAREYAAKALGSGEERGWVSHYRYRVVDTDYGKSVVFVNGEMNEAVTNRLLYTVFLVLAGSFLVILMLIIFISKRAVKPAAESYEKQKQFITDANHELKTPLTLILSNVDIVESEYGKSEWLDDIRSEGERMGALINQLVTLSRMDEDTSNLTISDFDLSGMASDVVSEFEGLAAEREKNLIAAIEPFIRYTGDEGLIRKLMAILLDNAVKYCDPEGQIQVSVYSKGRSPIISVENTYADVDSVELGRLFDRFYRADKARTYTGSFGIGLSIAESIVKNHKGEIAAYKKDANHIGFRATLK